MRVLSKKAVIGIGTLIVFLSVIIVAGISAGTILRTAGVLEQKSRAVGSDVRRSITSYVEINSIFGHANVADSYVSKLDIYGDLQLSSNPVLPKFLTINLEPFNLIYSYDQNYTFYNKPINLSFCNKKTIFLDLDKDTNVDSVEIVNNTFYWYFNNNEHVSLIHWASNTLYNKSLLIMKNNTALANISFSGYSTSDSCTSGVSITVIPLMSFGHFTIDFLGKNGQVINPGDQMKFLVSVPNLYSNKEYAITIMNKGAIESSYSFLIPDLYNPYVQLK